MFWYLSCSLTVIACTYIHHTKSSVMNKTWTILTWWLPGKLATIIPTGHRFSPSTFYFLYSLLKLAWCHTLKKLSLNNDQTNEINYTRNIKACCYWIQLKLKKKSSEGFLPVLLIKWTICHWTYLPIPSHSLHYKHIAYSSQLLQDKTLFVQISHFAHTACTLQKSLVPSVTRNEQR